MQSAAIGGGKGERPKQRERNDASRAFSVTEGFRPREMQRKAGRVTDGGRTDAESEGKRRWGEKEKAQGRECCGEGKWRETRKKWLSHLHRQADKERGENGWHVAQVRGASREGREESQARPENNKARKRKE